MCNLPGNCTYLLNAVPSVVRSKNFLSIVFLTETRESVRDA
jgi:hypothetical protein